MNVLQNTTLLITCFIVVGVCCIISSCCLICIESYVYKLPRFKVHCDIASEHVNIASKNDVTVANELSDT